MRFNNNRKTKRWLKNLAQYKKTDIYSLIRRSQNTEGEQDLIPLWNEYPREREEEYRDFWSKSDYLIGRQEWYNIRFNIKFKKYIPKNGNFLDYGCGTALIAFRLLLKRPDVNLYLADIPETITKPFAIWRLIKYNIKYKWYDILIDEKVEFNQHFDLIRIFDVLEHTFHPFRTVKNLTKCLNPKGYFIFTYINDPEAYLTNTIPGYNQRLETLEYIKNNFEKITSLIWKKKVNH